jgi:hypothetical protein
MTIMGKVENFPCRQMIEITQRTVAGCPQEEGL